MDELWNQAPSRHPDAWAREDGYEAHVRAAERIAEQREDFTRDVVKWGIWTGLALTFVFPLGVILLIWGAPSRIKRFRRLYLEPWNAERLRQGRLERGRRGRRSRRRRQAEVRKPTLQSLHLGHLVDAALDGLAPRLDELGVEVQREWAAHGELIGDAEALGAATSELLSLAVSDLAGDASATPRLEIELGENLAGDAIWLRVRQGSTRKPHSAPAALERVERAIAAQGGTLERAADGVGVETVVTLPKSR